MPKNDRTEPQPFAPAFAPPGGSSRATPKPATGDFTEADSARPVPPEDGALLPTPVPNTGDPTLAQASQDAARAKALSDASISFDDEVPAATGVADTFTVAQTPVNASKSQKLSTGKPQVPGYTLLECIGQGTYGVVWHARDEAGIDVAIKFFAHGTGLQWQLLLTEVRLLATLQTDPGIIQLRDVEPDAQPPYYIMSYAEGGCLGKRLEKGPLPLGMALPIFRQVVETLAYVHAKGIRHCDLKPGNILLDARGRARVADFGQAHLSDDASPGLGTFFFMAPEQADLSQKVADTHWDVYGLGALFYAMVTGEPPRKDPSIREELENTVELSHRLRRYQEWVALAPPPRKHHAVKGMDSDLAHIIDRCLKVDPAGRFRSAGSLLAALDWRERRLGQRPIFIAGLVGTFLLLVLLSVMGVCGGHEALEDAQMALIQQLGESNRASAEPVATQIHEELRKRIKLLKENAKDQELGQALKARDKDRLRQKLKAFYAVSNRKNPEASPEEASTEVTYWVVFDASNQPDHHGRIRAIVPDPEEPRPDLEKKNFSFRDYFSGQGRDLEEKKNENHKPVSDRHISQPFFTKFRGQRTLFIGLSVPILESEGKQPIGLLLATVKVEDLGKWLKKTKWIYSGIATLVNDQGRPLLHNDEDLIPKEDDRTPKEVYRGQELTDRLFSQNKPGFDPDFRDPINRKNYLAFYARVGKDAPYNTWGVILQHEHDQVVKPVNELQSKMISWGCLMLTTAILLLAGFWGSLYYVQRRRGNLAHG